MKEQNLDSPIYTENDHSVTLILKNNIEERNVKQKISAKVGVDSGVDSGGNNANLESKILEEIKNNEKVSIQQIADSTAIPRRSVERIIKSLKEQGIISRQGTKNGKWIILK